MTDDLIHHLPPYRIGPLFMNLDAGPQWWHKALGLEQAHQASRGKGVLAAIIDTGVDVNHPDLAGKIQEALDFTNSPSGAADQQGHGTHVAHTFLTVAPEAKILVLKGLGDDGSGAGSWIAAAIDRAVSLGADIISMSLGSSSEDQRITRALAAAEAADVFISLAAGNSGRRVDYPAAGPYGCANGAHDQNGRVAPFSGRGKEVDISGPGVNIVAAWPGGGYRSLSGTSMATPCVSGVAALLLSWSPSLTAAAVFEKMTKTAKDTGIPGRDSDYGWGLVSPEAALAVTPLPPTDPVRVGKYLVKSVTVDGREELRSWVG